MTHRIEKLRRHYPGLTLSQRTKLVLAAQARRDLHEIDTLDLTCPDGDLERYMLHLLVLERAAALLVVQLLAHAVLGIAKLGVAPDAPPASDLAPLFRSQAAIWRGFVAWCQDSGLDPHHVLAMAPLGVDDGDLACFIVHQQIESLDALPDDDCGLFDSGDVRTWRDFFARSSEHAKT
jgi:hypothetical protein